MNLGMDEQRETIADAPSNAHMIKRALLIVGIVVGVALVGVTIWVNVALAGGELKYADQTAPQIFAYKMTQTPAKPISGRAVKFSFTVTQDGQPVPNRNVVVAVSHATGPGINDRATDSLLKQVTTDSRGRVTVTHTMGFWSAGADKGFGVAIVPVLTDAEKETINRKSLAGVYGDDLSTGGSYDMPVVYPRWMGWLLWH